MIQVYVANENVKYAIHNLRQVLHKVIKSTVFNNYKICTFIIYIRVKSAPTARAKGTIFDAIINNWLNFPFVDMVRFNCST